MRERAQNAGREATLGARLHVVVHETDGAASAEASRRIETLDDATISAAQQVPARMDSVGQKWMGVLHGGGRGRLEIDANLRAGVEIERGGAGAALDGDPPALAETLVNAGLVGKLLAGSRAPRAAAPR